MKCPGQDTRYWKPGDIYEVDCPQCGKRLEFFKDDSSRRCGGCGKRILNPRIDYGCAQYCSYADQCLKELPPELLNKHRDLLKDRVAIEMKRYFEKDFKRIAHACKVARYAEQIARQEKGDMAVVLIAAYLHDIGIKEAERGHNSSAAKYQEALGPPVAKEILERLGAEPALTDEVCDIVGHHHSPRAEDTKSFKSLYDADMIVNLEEKNAAAPLTREQFGKIFDKSFLTVSGRRLAETVLAPAPGTQGSKAV